MILKLSVLIASVLQVVGASYLNMGTFIDTPGSLPVFIQPAGWAFSIWGLIYTLSFVYAIYQIIPKNDNKLLQVTRIPALIGFLSSIAWLYFAGMSNWSVWLTSPILFLMAISFIFVVNAKDTKDRNQTIFSKYILLPYAAWTGIASWLNVQVLLNDQFVITSSNINIITNLVLFLCIAAFVLYYFRKTKYSLWYGGVLIWAGIGVVFANLNEGLLVFAMLGGVLSLITLWLYTKDR
jgi:uncharacterized membrane protein